MTVIHLVDASPYLFRAFFSLPKSMVDDDGRPVVLRCHPDALGTRLHCDALWFLACGKRFENLASGHIDDAGDPRILVRNEQACAVVADRHDFRIGSARQYLDQFLLTNVDDADAIGRPIGWWQRALIDAGRRWG